MSATWYHILEFRNPIFLWNLLLVLEYKHYGIIDLGAGIFCSLIALL